MSNDKIIILPDKGYWNEIRMILFGVKKSRHDIYVILNYKNVHNNIMYIII
jgi:hypothetical protein